MRDPKIDPAPGDVLCSPGSTAIAVVTAAMDDVVTFKMRDLNQPDKTDVLTLGQWREAAQRSVTLAEKIEGFDRERAEVAARLAKIAAALAFLRGAK